MRGDAAQCKFKLQYKPCTRLSPSHFFVPSGEFSFVRCYQRQRKRLKTSIMHEPCKFQTRAVLPEMTVFHSPLHFSDGFAFSSSLPSILNEQELPWVSYTRFIRIGKKSDDMGNIKGNNRMYAG